MGNILDYGLLLVSEIEFEVTIAVLVGIILILSIVILTIVKKLQDK